MTDLFGTCRTTSEVTKQTDKCTYNATRRRVRESLLPWKSNKYYIFVCVCVCAWFPGRVGMCVRVALLIQHSTRMRRVVTSFVAPQAPPHFSTLNQCSRRDHNTFPHPQVYYARRTCCRTKLSKKVPQHVFSSFILSNKFGSLKNHRHFSFHIWIPSSTPKIAHVLMTAEHSYSAWLLAPAFYTPQHISASQTIAAFC